MRYLKLWWTFLKMSWMADMEYRFNFVVKIFGETGWYLAQLSIFEVLYLHTKTISGWDVHGMRVFMGALYLVDNLFTIFFFENMDVTTLVKRGDLDLYLVKPIDSQFMVSTRRVGTAYFINMFVIIGYLIWAIDHLPFTVGPLQIFSFAAMLGFGVISCYALRFMFATLTIILHDAGNVQFLWYQFYRLSTRPDPIYPFYLRVIVMTVFPVAFFASVPSRILVEGMDWRLLLLGPALALTLLFLSHVFWNKALKLYSSASS